MSRAVWWVVPMVMASGALALGAHKPAEKDSGIAIYGAYCATCHGKEAKGDGPLASSLRVAPADLTLIARRNHGKFDADKVRRTIDGRGPKEVHGGSDMPVWGDAFKRAGDGYSEAAVKERIDALVEYLSTIQRP